MPKSLLFIPDISGFTNFIQTTEVEHSQHVIAELLELLIESNTSDFQLAEVEGDALFFYKENEIPSLEMLLAQVEKMYTAFYSHLKLLETNRICPCNACATAPELELKIIVHSGDLQFITVKKNRKPFGAVVIEVHRLMKNSVDSDNYLLLSKNLIDSIAMAENYQTPLFSFNPGSDEYDGKRIDYQYAIINRDQLKLKPFAQAKKVSFSRIPDILFKKEFPVAAATLLEYITNFSHRQNWVQGVDKMEFNENEVNRLGTEHLCVVKGSDLSFITVTKEGNPGQLVYGELTTSPAPVDELYQFYIISPLTENACLLELEIYWNASNPFKKLLMSTLGKMSFKKNIEVALDSLYEFASNPVLNDA